MWKEGCCSGSVAQENGLGTKRVRDNRTGVIYDVCEYNGWVELDEPVEVKDPKNPDNVRMVEKFWGCTNHSDDRPEICKSFMCDRLIEETIRED
jgi:hypothetical protein